MAERRVQAPERIRPGLKLASLVVLRPQGLARWLCRCFCGATFISSDHYLRYGTARGCGCWRRDDLTGKRFGRWVVVEKGAKRGRASTWRCRCDCGATRDVRTRGLRDGTSQSCGCLHLEVLLRGTKPHVTWKKCRARGCRARGNGKTGAKGLCRRHYHGHRYRRFAASIRAKNRQRSYERTATASGVYLRALLGVRGRGLSLNPVLLEAKRAQLQVHRLVKELS